ncbi:hypothetical protein Lal_00015725 [Lupinus albus]|nr:hypothetical protein Lal_00015725 [Lupinus albus]
MVEASGIPSVAVKCVDIGKNTATRRTLPGLDMVGTFRKLEGARKGAYTQVVHGCRQLVS